MEEVIRNKYVVTKGRIDGRPDESDFSISEGVLSLNIQHHHPHHDVNTTTTTATVVIVKNLYVSIDPYQINRMKTESCSQKIIPTVVPVHAIEANGVGRVVNSSDPQFKKGDLVSGLLHWGEYSVLKAGYVLQKLDPMGFPLSYYAGGVLGSSGLAAYGGFFKVCKPKKGDKVFVSAASGSVGILVGQYAKLFGCYVVGCAGTKQKVDLLKEKIGFDDAFNYKEETDLNSTLQRYFPEGIDIYFDNVGGKMLEAAIENMNIFGRIAACGSISTYTDTQNRAKPDIIGVIYKRIRIEGFLILDFNDIYGEFISTTVEHLRTGKMQVIEDISHGVESIPTAFLDLFRGNNVGKKVVRIAQD